MANSQWRGWELRLEAAALLVHDAEGGLDDVVFHIEHGPEADGAFAAADDEQAEFVGAFPEGIARGGVGQIEGQHEPAATDGGDGGILAGQGVEFGQEALAFDAGVFDQAAPPR